MDAINIPEQITSTSWTYDEEVDVLYVLADPPRPAVGIDIGDGLVVRYDETHHEVVGLTIIGLRDRLVRNLDASADEFHAGDRM